MVVCVGLAPLIARQAGQPVAPLAGALNGPAPKASVAGVVLRSTTGEPIARATVTLTRVAPATPGTRGGGLQPQPGQPAQPGQQQAPQQPATFTTATDDQVKSQFKDVDEGPYRIIAARNGFARQEYGQRSFN